MKKLNLSLAIAAITSGLIACTDNNDSPVQSDASSVQLSLSVAGTYVSGNEFDTASAEIVTYDDCSDRLFVVNAEAGSVDVLAMDASSEIITKEHTIDLSPAAADAGFALGDANSVSTNNCKLAIALQADNKQAPGVIALFDYDAEIGEAAFTNTYLAGALPDMVSFSDDGMLLLAANEGEPSDDYSVDPEGSVTIVDLSGGESDSDAVITQIGFTDYNAGQAKHGELPATLRLPGPAGTSVAQDLEPEYLAITDAGKAYVALQENNALAIIDLATKTVDGFADLGLKPWDAASGNQLDVSNKDNHIGNFDSYEQLVGLYMPDTIVSFTQDGNNYLVTANEGDGREYIYESTQYDCVDAGHDWDGDDYNPASTEYITELDDCISFTDEGRGDDLNVDALHPLATNVADGDLTVSRIKVVMDNENIGADDNILTFGARSFSIWDEAGELVFDSGDMIAKKVFELDSENFNSTNDTNDSADSRSDDKGIEPEAVEVAKINDRTYIFVGLERMGGIMVFDATNVEAPVYQSYINNRDFTADVCTLVDPDEDRECSNDTYNPAAKDLAPESIEYFTRNDGHFIAVGNEVSGTTTVFEIDFVDL